MLNLRQLGVNAHAEHQRIPLNTLENIAESKTLKVNTIRIRRMWTKFGGSSHVTSHVWGEKECEKNYCDLYDKMFAAIEKTPNNSGMVASLNTQ